jgi:uncharacterized protein (DUF488 family)
MIWTVGHSTRTLDDFLALLRAHEIQSLVDVRSVPRSRRHPHFGIDRLPRELEALGIDYVHLASLGGLKQPRADSSSQGIADPAFRGYADHMRTPEFENGLTRLIELARARRVVILCAEKDPSRCHRSMIADALVARKLEVAHILDGGPVRPHVLDPRAVREGDRVTYPGPFAGTLDLEGEVPSRERGRP